VNGIATAGRSTGRLRAGQRDRFGRRTVARAVGTEEVAEAIDERLLRGRRGAGAGRDQPEADELTELADRLEGDAAAGARISGATGAVEAGPARNAPEVEHRDPLSLGVIPANYI
jgi:hypothetical protein